jgi:hypothetical protein
LHRHPYEETFIAEDAKACSSAGQSSVEAAVAALRQIGIHPGARMATEWLK